MLGDIGGEPGEPQGEAEIWANNLVTQEPAPGLPTRVSAGWGWPGGADTALGTPTPFWGPQELHLLSHFLLPPHGGEKAAFTFIMWLNTPGSNTL